MKLFDEFGERPRTQVFKRTSRRAGNILIRNTRRELRAIDTNSGALKSRTKNRWNGRTMEWGVRQRVARKGYWTDVGLKDDFRLKFFELGTTDRTTKRGDFRGRISAHYFFKKAKEKSKTEIFTTQEQIIRREINWVNNKYNK